MFLDGPSLPLFRLARSDFRDSRYSYWHRFVRTDPILARSRPFGRENSWLSIDRFDSALCRLVYELSVWPIFPICQRAMVRKSDWVESWNPGRLYSCAPINGGIWPLFRVSKSLRGGRPYSLDLFQSQGTLRHRWRNIQTCDASRSQRKSARKNAACQDFKILLSHFYGPHPSRFWWQIRQCEKIRYFFIQRDLIQLLCGIGKWWIFSI